MLVTCAKDPELPAKVASVEQGMTFSLEVNPNEAAATAAAASSESQSIAKSSLEDSDVLAYTKEPEFTEEESASTEQGPMTETNHDQAAATAATCLEDCWPPADCVGTTD